MRLSGLLILVAGLSFGQLGAAGVEGMPHMPSISAKKTYTVQSTDDGESLQDQRGFGDQEGMVRMMNLMMVEGSGMEGMDMTQTTMASSSEIPQSAQSELYVIQWKLNPESPRVGSNLLELTIQHKKDQKPAGGLKLKAFVAMTSMDMGTEEPKVKEVSPGKYQVKLPFSMQGPWAVRIRFPDGKETELSFDVGQSKQK